MPRLLSAASVRSLLNKLTFVTPVTIASATNASPAVYTVTAGHGFSVGDVIVQHGMTGTGTVSDGIFSVNTTPLATTYTLKTTAGVVVNNDGTTTGGTALRVLSGLKPHDLLDLIRTLNSMSYKRDSDATAASGSLESTLQTIFGQ